MSFVAILVGLGCGMLLAAVSFGLWSDCRGARVLGRSSPSIRSLSRGAHAVAWTAAGVLMVGALLAWGSGLPALESLIGGGLSPVVDAYGHTLEGPILSLILMAALAIPLKVDAPRTAAWSCALLYLPASLLALAALIRVVTPGAAVLSAGWVTPVRFSLAVCGGLGGRSLGQSLHVVASGAPSVEWPGKLTYGLTTFLFGSASLVSLWQRGALWGGADPVLRGGIAGAWLAWSAGWLVPRRYPRLRGGLTIVAAMLLILAAIKPA